MIIMTHLFAHLLFWQQTSCGAFYNPHQFVCCHISRDRAIHRRTEADKDQGERVCLVNSSPGEEREREREGEGEKEGERERGRGRRRGRGRGGGGGRGRGTLTKSIPSKRNTNLEEPSYLAKFPANHQDSPCCMILSAVPILFSFFSFFIYISFHEWNSHWSREERPRAFVNIVQKRVYHVSTCVVFVAYFFPLQRLSSIGGYK